MKTITTVTALVLFLSFNLFAQPIINWETCYGGSSFDVASEFHLTPDGGYIIIGQTESDNGDVSGNHGSLDYWLIKLDINRNIEWQKCLGGSQTDRGNTCQVTTDESYIVSGLCDSNDGDVSGNHGQSDYWIVKVDAQENTIWKKCYGGSQNEVAYNMKQTTDGGYVIAGLAYSNEGDVSGNHGQCDYWVIKIDDMGTIEWQNALGGYQQDVPSCVQQTTDGGFIVVGSTLSDDGDVTGYHGVFDIWGVKLDGNGILEWQRCYGGSAKDGAKSVLQTTDGGYIIAGNTESTDGDVTGNHGSTDCWIVKIDNLGNIQWQKCLGGSGVDLANSIIQTTKGNYIMAGSTKSDDGDVSGNHGDNDCWIVELDTLGNLQWQLCAGGSSSDYASSILQTPAGNLVFVGGTYSNDGDVSSNHGSVDYWLVELDYFTGIMPHNTDFTLFPNPVDNSGLTISTNHHGPLMVKLLDLRGTIVLETLLLENNKHIDMDYISDGIYIIQISDRSKIIHQQKMIKSSN